jgi:hypothetical protein
MVKKKRIKEFKEPKKRISLSLEDYQRAVKRAGEPEIVQNLQNIYTKSEERRQAQKATRLAKQSSRGFVGTGLSSSKISQGEKTYSTKARKLLNLIAPKGSLVKSLTYGGGVSRGRGRPTKTYKARFVPGVGYVRVPTAVYNKMISEYKTRQRLLQAQQQSFAEQQAMQTDPRYQYTSEDQFLEEDFSQPSIQEYPQQAMPIQQQPQIYSQEAPQLQNQPNMMQRLSQSLSNVGRTPMRRSPYNPQQNPFFHPPETPLYGNSGYQQPQMGQVVREPQVTVISEKSSLLNVGSQFDKPENAQILFKRRYI